MEVIRDRYLDDTKVVDGVRYTTQDDPNKLSNDDFLELLIEELKNQDPTDPQDTDSMLNSELQMSTIDTNKTMSESLTSLENAYATSALSSSVTFMGKTVEDGTVDETTGRANSYKVATVESEDGQVFLNANKQTGFYEKVREVDEDDDGNTVYSDITYDETGKFYDADGEDTGVNAVINDDGTFKIVDGKYLLLDNDGEEITDEDTLSKYEISSPIPVYDKEFTKIAMTDIKEVHE